LIIVGLLVGEEIGVDGEIDALSFLLCNDFVGGSEVTSAKAILA
jgi:hypothetical protein